VQFWVTLFFLCAALGGGAQDAVKPLPPRLEAISPRSLPEWISNREKLQADWFTVLGSLPRQRPELHPEILSTEHLLHFSRLHVRHQSEPGVFTDGYLLKPHAAKRAARALVVFHPTTPSQAKAVAGLDPSYPEEKWMGLQFATNGYVVWCPRNYIYREGANWSENAARVRAGHTNWTGMTQMVWDAIRAADFLESLPEVDPRRIGCIGHSLGAKSVLYAMAFDSRYQAGVASEAGIGLPFSNWDADWYLGSAIRDSGLKLDHHQLLALAAPRAFLLLAGESADGDGSQVYLDAAAPVYRLLGKPENLVLYNHRQGHRYPTEAKVVAEAFLDRHIPR